MAAPGWQEPDHPLPSAREEDTWSGSQVDRPAGGCGTPGCWRPCAPCPGTVRARGPGRRGPRRPPPAHRLRPDHLPALHRRGHGRGPGTHRAASGCWRWARAPATWPRCCPPWPGRSTAVELEPELAARRTDPGRAGLRQRAPALRRRRPGLAGTGPLRRHPPELRRRADPRGPVGAAGRGGRIILPMGPPGGAQELILARKTAGGSRVSRLMPVGFVPLQAGHRDPAHRSRHRREPRHRPGHRPGLGAAGDADHPGLPGPGRRGGGRPLHPAPRCRYSIWRDPASVEAAARALAGAGGRPGEQRRDLPGRQRGGGRHGHRCGPPSKCMCSARWPSSGASCPACAPGATGASSTSAPAGAPSPKGSPGRSPTRCPRPPWMP